MCPVFVQLGTMVQVVVVWIHVLDLNVMVVDVVMVQNRLLIVGELVDMVEQVEFRLPSKDVLLVPRPDVTI